MSNAPEDAATTKMRVPCEVYSRIVGYLRPVQDWNEGKQQEFAERSAYDVHEPVDEGQVERSQSGG